MAHNEAHLLPFLFANLGSRIDAAVVIVHPDYDDDTAIVAKELCEKYCLEYRIEEWDHPEPHMPGTNIGMDASKSRNQVLDLAREFDKDYVLWLDPDDPLVGTIPDDLDADVYNIEVDAHGTSWVVEHLIARECTDINWQFAIHESLTCGSHEIKLLDGCRIQRADGSGGGTDRMKVWDLPLLLKLVEEDPTSGHYWYYLAQTYRDLKKTAEAVAAFNHRAEMGGVQSLVYWCRFQVAELTNNVDDYLVAWNCYPERQEALHRLAAIYNAKGCFYAARAFCYLGLPMKPTMDAGFIERWVEEYGLLAECAVSEYNLGNRDKAIEVFEYILGNVRSVSPIHRAIFSGNLEAMKKEIAAEAKPIHKGRVTTKKKAAPKLKAVV